MDEFEYSVAWCVLQAALRHRQSIMTDPSVDAVNYGWWTTTSFALADQLR